MGTIAGFPVTLAIMVSVTWILSLFAMLTYTRTASVLGGATLALMAGVLLLDRRARIAMIALTVLLIGACVVTLRLADLGIDRETAYVINAAGCTPWHDRGFAHLEGDASFKNVDSPTIRLDVQNAGPDTVCAETTQCMPDGPDLTYVRTKHSHGYVVRRGYVNVRVMGLVVLLVTSDSVCRSAATAIVSAAR